MNKGVIVVVHCGNYRIITLSAVKKLSKGQPSIDLPKLLVLSRKAVRRHQLRFSKLHNSRLQRAQCFPSDNQITFRRSLLQGKSLPPNPWMLSMLRLQRLQGIVRVRSLMQVASTGKLVSPPSSFGCRWKSKTSTRPVLCLALQSPELCGDPAATVNPSEETRGVNMLVSQSKDKIVENILCSKHNNSDRSIYH